MIVSERESMQFLLNRLGFSFLVIDEAEWVKVTLAVEETLGFDG